MIGASPTISNTLFQETNRCGLYLAGTSAPTVNNCVFDDLNYPMITALMAFPGSYSGNVLSGTTSKAIAIIDDETLTQDYTMVKRDFAGIVNIPYLFNRYTVGTSAVLTIEPGVILKFMQSGWMNVRNGLIADGGSTADSAIIFTADRDDFYGGDTYGDGDANLAHRQWWWGIYFAEEYIDASCLVNNAIVKYASRRYSSSPSIYNRGGITMDNASPTVTNTLFESDYFGIVGRNTSLPHITNCDFIDSDPSGYAIWNETGVVTIVAEDCWWNDVSGPYHPTLNPGGEGERVSNNVDFDPWISQSAKPILGDVSLNGEVMPYDASLVLQHTVGNITLDSRQLDVADVSGNGEVTSYDASLILQYTIGLITGFDQSAKKSVADVLQPMISAPGFFETTQGEAFELPLIITTHAGIKSIDLEIRIDQNQLQFKGLNSEQLPSDLMVASGFNAGTGILKIALTSAYDLDLNMHQLLLRFEASASGEGSSVIEHQRLLANEKEIPEELFAVEVRISNNATNVELAPGLEAMKIFSWEEQIVAELYLSEAQSEIHVSVYDLTGRRINSMAIDHVVPGQHTVTFEAEPGGMGGSPRTYLVHVRGDTFTVTRKLIVR